MPEILDSSGKVIQRPDTELAGERQEFGARSVQNRINVDTLSPRKFKSLLMEAESGNLASQADLFERMEEGDGEMDGHLRTRKHGVKRCSWSIEAPEEVPAGQTRAAEDAVVFAREVIGDIPNMDDAIFDLLDAISKGYAAREIEWEADSDRWWPVELHYRPQRDFTTDDGQTLRLRETGTDSSALNDLNWVVHKERARSGYLARTPLMRSLTRCFIIRKFGWKDWARFAELFGQPIRMGKIPDGIPWDHPDVQKMVSAVQALGVNAWAVIREGWDLDLVEQSGNPTGAIYEAMIDRAGKEMTLAILGQLLTSQGEQGGSYALGEVHNQVRWDLIESDAQSLEDTLTERLVEPVVKLNLGNVPVPRFSFRLEKPEDQAVLAEVIATLVEAGAQIPEEWVHERFGIPQAEEGQSVLVPPAARALGGQNSLTGTATRTTTRTDTDRHGTARRRTVPARARREALPAPEQAPGAQEALNQMDADDVRDSVVPEDGLALLDEKRVATSEAWESLGPAGKQRAWFVTGLEQQAIAQVGREIVQTLRQRRGQGTFLERLESDGISVPGSQTPREGQIGAGQARLVYHQNRMNAYGADRWIKAQRTKQARPYAEYLTAGDERVRPKHAALHGIVKPLDDPFWNRHWPPWEFRCRCSAVTVSREAVDSGDRQVADLAEEAARYQSALMMQGQPYSDQQFQEAYGNLVGDMRQKSPDVLEQLRAPGNPKWTFNRNDAYYLQSQGGAPATDAGREELEILSTLPTIDQVLS